MDLPKIPGTYIDSVNMIRDTITTMYIIYRSNRDHRYHIGCIKYYLGKKKLNIDNWSSYYSSYNLKKILDHMYNDIVAYYTSNGWFITYTEILDFSSGI